MVCGGRNVWLHLVGREVLWPCSFGREVFGPCSFGRGVGMWIGMVLIGVPIVVGVYDDSK